MKISMHLVYGLSMLVLCFLRNHGKEPVERQLSMQQTALERSVSTQVIQFCNIDKKNYECRMRKKF